MGAAVPLLLRFWEEGVSIKFYSLDEAKAVYGEDSLIPISSLKQIIFYTAHGLQPEFIWESEKEKGKIVAWFHKNKSELIYRRWLGNRPEKTK